MGNNAPAGALARMFVSIATSFIWLIEACGS